MVPPEILSKIHKLLILAQSSNENEANNAKVMADKLISKHNVSQEELDSLKEKKPLYGDDEKVFSTIGLCNWKQQLVFVIGRELFCKIVQEESVPFGDLSDAPHEYTYFAYGEPEDVISVQFAYEVYSEAIQKLIDKNCLMRGNGYIVSYAEGILKSVQNNIEMEGINVPDIVKQSPIDKEVPKEEKVLNTGDSNLARPDKTEKENPVEASTNISGSVISDIGAYFKGVKDGYHLSMQDILELEAENKKSLQLK